MIDWGAVAVGISVMGIIGSVVYSYTKLSIKLDAHLEYHEKLEERLKPVFDNQHKPLSCFNNGEVMKIVRLLQKESK